MVFSDVLTTAEINRPSVIEAIGEHAMARISSSGTAEERARVPASAGRQADAATSSSRLHDAGDQPEDEQLGHQVDAGRQPAARSRW